jgi:glutathione peroxidase
MCISFILLNEYYFCKDVNFITTITVVKSLLKFQISKKMKKMLWTLLILMGVVASIYAIVAGKDKINYDTKGDKTIYQFTMNTLDGKPKNLADYKGKVLLVINVASKCGLTPQYKDIEKFYKEYKEMGVEVLGFPANNFLGQEPGSSEQIAEFCQKNYGVTFDMFEKISVKGKDIHPLYQFLTSKDLNGNVDAPVSWNFQKFLIGKNGEVIAAYSPKISVYDAEVLDAVKVELSKK